MFKYYIDNKEFKPLNTGNFTLDWQLVTDAGAYHYTKSLNGAVNFGEQAYSLISKYGDCQKILFRIDETCGQNTFTIYDGFFTNRAAKWNPDLKILEVEMSNNTLYDCLTRNYDKTFNFLETPNIVSSEFIDSPQYQFIVDPIPTSNITYNKPFYGSEATFSGGNRPYAGIGTPPNVQFFALFVREVITTYCQGGEPQQPEGTGWEILLNACEAKGVTTWYRKPDLFNPITVPAIAFERPTCTPLPCTPTPPPVTANERWFLINTLEFPADNYSVSFYIDLNELEGELIDLNNGRLLLDVLNYGLNKIGCEDLDIQSIFLNAEINPVTGNSPSSTQGIQLHAISDIKQPDATEPATREDTTVKAILESYISGKLNCFWYIDEGTDRLIIEHYKDLFNQGQIDITAFQKFKNSFEYDNTDVPTAEEFETFDDSIDFTGVPILYNNPCADGVKTYPNDGFFSEVDQIIRADDYPNDGIVAITPDSLTQDGARAENGAITGDYRANMPQAMANLHSKFWGYYRPFDFGNLNFNPTEFDQPKPVKVLEDVEIDNCCFFDFNPRSEFIGNDFDKGQLDNASFSFTTRKFTLKIKY